MPLRARSVAIVMFIGLSFLFGAGVSATEPTELRLVSTVWPPFTDVAGQPRLASDLVHEALERAGVQADTAIVADGLLVPSMSDRSFAGSGALWYSEERERFLLYSEPYMENRLVLVGRKGSDPNVSSFSQLAGKRVALVKGYAYGHDQDDASNPTFVVGDSIEQNLRRVLDGRADFMVIDELVIRYIVREHRQDAKALLEIGSTPLLTRSLHFAVRKDVPGARGIIARFNDEIPRMMADGTYNEILGMAWINADVDGDGLSELVLGGDHAGVSPPTDAYAIVSDGEPKKTDLRKLRFLIGGKLYQDWEEVPDHYKTPLPPPGTDPDPASGALVKIKF